MCTECNESETLVLKNAMICTACGGSVDRHKTHFECTSCGAIGDLVTGIMTDLSYPNQK
jgi:hypothetical protein